MEGLIHSEKFTNLLGDESVQCIRCSICLDYFERPVVLTCGHTFCFNCIKDTADHVLSQNPSKPPWHVYLCCPQCRKPTNAYQTSHNHVPVNYTVASLVHALKQVHVPATRAISTNTEKETATADSQTETDDLSSKKNSEYVYDVERLDKIESDLEKFFSEAEQPLESNIIDDAKKDIEDILKSLTCETIIELEKEMIKSAKACNDQKTSTSDMCCQASFVSLKEYLGGAMKIQSPRAPTRELREQVRPPGLHKNLSMSSTVDVDLQDPAIIRSCCSMTQLQTKF